MRDGNVFNLKRALPRMSWSAKNLYNLWSRSLGPLSSETNFTKSAQTLFQQRWRSKRFVRAYHGDWIGENKFKRWYLPERLPDVRPRHLSASGTSSTSGSSSSRGFASDDIYLSKWAKRDRDAKKDLRAGREAAEKAASTPVGSLMFMEVERRLDVFLFRCCFATSAYQARQLVVHGKVMLNGVKHTNPNALLNPGDMVSVDPAAMPLLRIRQVEEEAQVEEKEEETTTTAETASTSESSAKDKAQAQVEEAPAPKEPTEKKPSAPKWTLPAFAAPNLFVPAYIEPSFATCSAVYVRHPTARPGYSEIPSPYDADGEVMRFAWEWYAKHRPRMRGRKERWTSPETARA